jgi:phage shock protein PspC (stress-responsive transcriptional regulator)
LYNLKFVDTFDCTDLQKNLTYVIGICDKFHIPSTLFVVVVVVTVTVVVFTSVVGVVIISSMFMKRKQNFSIMYSLY